MTPQVTVNTDDAICLNVKLPDKNTDQQISCLENDSPYVTHK